MLLYHGSKKRLEYLESRQASGEPEEGKVHPDELLQGIYLTPDYGFAVAMAARPDGATEIDDEAREITFEKPESFDPESDIFIYSFDPARIPAENLKHIDKWQSVVTGIHELRPDSTEQTKARKVLDYYKILNWEEKELNRETSSGIKFR